ncbi:SPX domain-containing protein 2-like [Humulus lupulus]|uniref:SPX domain-containing protein 2-like n=1 Tax=Humulus lupulus TaxID=3486 RepID=UPI002B40AE97|nr:SPX domain-containing protein 2-like [Humulus lupulus]
MKFWKILSSLLEEIFPEWRDRFLSYKSLKKQLKFFYPKSCNKSPPKRSKLSHADDEEEAEVTEEVAVFLQLLNDEIHKFNEFFVQKEEDYIIAWKELRDRITKARDSNEDVTEVGKKLVDLHGEMVLLEIYSILNYTGLVKITKKHDKLSGALIRASFIQGVLQEPFFSTDVVKTLVEECGTMLDNIFSRNELVEIEQLESTYVKLTLLALQVLKDIRGESSTVGPHSISQLHRDAEE